MELKPSTIALLGGGALLLLAARGRAAPTTSESNDAVLNDATTQRIYDLDGNNSSLDYEHLARTSANAAEFFAAAGAPASSPDPAVFIRPGATQWSSGYIPGGTGGTTWNEAWNAVLETFYIEPGSSRMEWGVVGYKPSLKWWDNADLQAAYNELPAHLRDGTARPLSAYDGTRWVQIGGALQPEYGNVGRDDAAWFANLAGVTPEMVREAATKGLSLETVRQLWGFD